MSEIIFTSVTPIFNFEIQPPTGEFLHSGSFGGAKYSVVLKRFREGEPGFEKLWSYVEQSPNTLGRLISRTSDSSITKWTAAFLSDFLHVTDYFLVVETTQSLDSPEALAEERNNLAGASKESHSVSGAVLDALRLHSSRGLQWYQTCLFRSPLHQAYPRSESAITPPVNPLSISYLGAGRANFVDSDFESARSTINSLLRRKDATSTFDRVLSLASAYYRISFNLESCDHAFLILMVVFETLFKSEKERSSVAAARISKMLADSKKTAEDIENSFTQGDSSFTKLRNKIAHGDPTLDSLKVLAKYPELHRYVTKAMIRLLAVPDGTLDATKDYYEEIERVIRTRFDALPE